MTIATLLTGAILLVVLYTLHKMRRVHLMMYRLSDDLRANADSLYEQLDALQALYVELKLDAGLPATRGWSASPDFLLLLERHVRAARPKVIVECGSGTSTVVLARAAQLNGSGHVFSMEHEPRFTARTREHLVRHGLGEWATVIDTPLRTYEFDGAIYPWYSDQPVLDLKADMVVIDGPPESVGPLARYPAGPNLFPRLSAGATVFLDDAARDDEKRIVERWMREFPGVQRLDHPCEKGCVSLTWISDSSGGCGALPVECQGDTSAS